MKKPAYPAERAKAVEDIAPEPSGLEAAIEALINAAVNRPLTRDGKEVKAVRDALAALKQGT